MKMRRERRGEKKTANRGRRQWLQWIKVTSWVNKEVKKRTIKMKNMPLTITVS